jgi:hypothetical protein
MNEKPKESEAENKQEPTTVIPIAVLLVMIEMLEEMRVKDPEFIDKLIQRLSKIKETSLGEAYPKSVDLIAVLAKQLGAKL